MSYQDQLLLYRITVLLAAYSTIIWILGLLLFLWGHVIMWRIFERAGEPGWKSLIPLYSEWIIVRNILGRGIGSYILFIVMMVLVGMKDQYKELDKAISRLNVDVDKINELLAEVTAYEFTLTDELEDIRDN